MDSLHTVLRSIRGETKSQRRGDHMTVFREFLNQLDRIGKTPRPAARNKSARPKRRGK